MAAIHMTEGGGHNLILLKRDWQGRRGNVTQLDVIGHARTREKYKYNNNSNKPCPLSIFYFYFVRFYSWL